jgi:hypothetical protein
MLGGGVFSILFAAKIERERERERERAMWAERQGEMCRDL